MRKGSEKSEKERNRANKEIRAELEKKDEEDGH